MILRRLFSVVGTVVTVALAMAAPASAHTPVVLDSSDRVPWVAPLVVDGTDPVSFYGALTRPYTVRSGQFAMAAGQAVTLTLAIPDVAPEKELSVADLPRVVLLAPDCSVTVLDPQIRVPVHEPELGLDFLILRGYTATAMAGTYSFVVTGRVASRFVVLTGTEGGDFHGIKRGAAATDEQVLHWYATAP